MPSTSEPALAAPVSPNPLGDAAASEDQVGLAVNALLTAIAASVTLFSLITWGTVQLTWASGVTDISQVTPRSASTTLMAFGSMGTILLVGLFGWVLLAPIRSNFRRGGIAMVGTLAGTVVSVILTSVARWALTAHGLLLLMLLAGFGVRYFLKRTRAATLALPSSHAT